MKSILLKTTLVLSFVLLINSAFSPNTERFTELEKKRSQTALEHVEQCLVALKTSIQDQDLKEARIAFHKAKRHYKSAEYLLEYFHHSLINKSINGAPLPKIEQNVADMNIFDPQGFQRLEELLYDDQADWNDLNTVSQKLSTSINRLIQFHPNTMVFDRHVLEAMRFELLRIATLSIVGFENPANTDSCFVETRVAFMALKEPAMHYAAMLSKEKAEQMAVLFEKGKKHLEHTDFNTFNRFRFIKDVSDPLFKSLYQVHTDLGFETFEETNSAPIATNYNAQSLFDINLLNKDYFFKAETKTNYQAKLDLGRILFFDPVLSANNALSCGSCHNPNLAFTDGKAKSVSNDQKTSVDRNSPTLVNALFAGAYFHDLRSDRLEKQTEHVMVSEKEFNTLPLKLSDKLAQSTEYKALFDLAYPNQGIKPHTLQNALATYVASLVSWDSEFDQAIRGEVATVEASIENGFNLFMGKASCGTCHFAPNFSGLVPPFYDDTESEVLGILASADSINPTLDNDLGRYANGKLSERAEHFKNSIKTPTIRNIELTAPYFHNGGFNTLEDVMWFYNNGGGAGLGLSVPHQTLPDSHLGLSQKELSDIIAFMKSLTDVAAFQTVPKKLPVFENSEVLNNRSLIHP